MLSASSRPAPVRIWCSGPRWGALNGAAVAAQPDLPAADDLIVDWLYAWWERIDDWIDAHRRADLPAAAPSP